MPPTSNWRLNVHERLKQLALPTTAAGRHLTTKVPSVSPANTLQEVQELLVDHPQEFDTFNYIYVVNKLHKLIGVFSIDKIFLLPSDTVVRDIMVRKLVVSRPQVDQERAANLALKHNIKAIPIVDRDRTFMGVIPSDQILEIIHHEHQEDLLHLSGIVPHMHNGLLAANSTILNSAWHRVPWILIGLMGGLLTAKVIGGFEAVLEEHLILATFIPLVSYVANAVGTQTQTLYIRELSSNKINIVTYGIKQLLISAIIGAACWGLLQLLALLFWKSFILGLVVGASVMSAIMAAAFFALIIPYTLDRLGQDPAVGAGPFATIIQDLLSVVIYLLIASVLI